MVNSKAVNALRLIKAYQWLVSGELRAFPTTVTFPSHKCLGFQTISYLIPQAQALFIMIDPRTASHHSQADSPALQNWAHEFVCLIGKPCDQKVRVASTPFFPKSFAHLCPVGSCSQQNNLKELFLLLSFICPQIFIDYVGLDSFLPKDSDSTQIEKSKNVVEVLHNSLHKITKMNSQVCLTPMSMGCSNEVADARTSWDKPSWSNLGLNTSRTSE